jgi:hypothetical protein
VVAEARRFAAEQLAEQWWTASPRRLVTDELVGCRAGWTGSWPRPRAAGLLVISSVLVLRVLVLIFRRDS